MHWGGIAAQTIFLIALTLLITGIFVAGVIFRQKKGVGFEGKAILNRHTVKFEMFVWMNARYTGN